MDIDLELAEKKRRDIKRFVVYPVAALVLAVVLMGVWLLGGKDHEWHRAEWRVSATGSHGLGSFIASGQRSLTSGEAATVQSIYKEPGERLQTGDIVLQLESSILRNELEQARVRLRRAEIEQKEAALTAEQGISELELDLRKARISLKIAAAELEAHKALLETNVVSELRYAQIQANYDQRQSELDAVLLRQAHRQRFQVQRKKMMEELVSLERLNVARVEQRLENLTVRVSEPVVVKEILVAEGDTVQPGTRLAVIGRERPDGVRLRFPQQDVSRLRVGTPLLLSANDVEFTATIQRIMPDLQDGFVVIETGSEGIPDDARVEMSVRGQVQEAGESKVIAVYQPDYSLIPGQTVELLLRRNGKVRALVLSDVIRDGNWLVFPSQVEAGDELAFVSS